MRGYSKLRKAELLSLLYPKPPPKSKISIPALNIKNASINVPVLQPEIAVVKESQAPSFIEKNIETFSGWLNWLAESGQKYIVKPISSTLKNLKENINKIFEEEEEKEFELKEGESALSRFVRQFTIDGKSGYDPQTFLEAVRNLVLQILRDNRKTKVKSILKCKTQRTDLATGEIDEVDADFHSEIEENLEGTNENELYAEMIARIAENIALFQRRGSNWQFVAVLSLEIHLVDFQPLSGSTFIHLPKKIADKKAVINMENRDDQCFKWSVTRALNPVVKNASLITEKLEEQSEKLNWSGLEFPVKLKQIRIFEKENPKISANVFGFEVVFPLQISKTKRTQIVNLLLISDVEKKTLYRNQEYEQIAQSALDF